MSLNALALQFPDTGTNKPSPMLYQHDNAPEHRARFINTWFANVGA